MFCPNCGKEIPGESKFCFNCGSAIPSVILSEKPSDEPNSAISSHEPTSEVLSVVAVSEKPSHESTSAIPSVAAGNEELSHEPTYTMPPIPKSFLSDGPPAIKEKTAKEKTAKEKTVKERTVKERPTKERSVSEIDDSFIVCKPHWINYVVPIALAVLCVIGAILNFIEKAFNDGFLMLVGAVLFAGIAFLVRISKSLKLNDTRIVGKIGLIRTRKFMSPIGKIQDIGVNKTVFGRIFRYSTVVVNTAGTGASEYVFKRITNGDELQKRFIEIAQ